MLKTFTLSLGLVLALSLSGVSRAGGLLHHDTYASAQGPVASPQYVAPSPQSDCGPVCDGGCAPKGCGLLKKCLGGLHGLGGKCAGGFNGLCDRVGHAGGCLKKKFHHETYYTYEWVLKKTKHKVKNNCTPSCGPVCETVHASEQYAPAPSPQAGYSSPQSGYGSPQAYGSGQLTGPAPAPVASAAPVGDVAPPAPEIAPATPPAPPVGPQSRLLFSTPSGN